LDVIILLCIVQSIAGRGSADDFDSRLSEVLTFYFKGHLMLAAETRSEMERWVQAIGEASRM
jgi:hypothetical protein